MVVHRLEIEAKSDKVDAVAAETVHRLQTHLGVNAGRVRTRRVYHLDLDIDAQAAERVLEALCDPVSEQGAVGNLPDPEIEGRQPQVLQIGFKPGVTDTVAISVHRAVNDALGRVTEGRVYSSTAYLFYDLSAAAVEDAAMRLLHNPMIETMRLHAAPRSVDLTVPKAGAPNPVVVETVPLRDADDAELVRRSKDGMLALTLEEMQSIAAHFRGLGRDPTDAELECLAQTWSEHCKHKIFASPIDYTDPDGKSVRIDSLFKTYIRGVTDGVAKARLESGVDPEDAPFLVSVFHDNAGVVRFSDDDHLAFKVETHNSPSALDPYGGAMTGIVGVNRDSFGTGVGADLLTNVWGYCFGDPRYDGEVPKGLMHPRRIRDGVHRGVVDGGNQSGVPYSRGWELFDARYLGKPLVYCGTVSVMPATAGGFPTHEKRTEVGDRVVMVGGRIGKDGIHGATFSSAQLDDSAPVQAVQIGDPITQKMMFDMLTEARDRGLMTAMTDNGAGGLSSSVGEMAEKTGGARIDLQHAPLKYPGLQPWEILISEAQERMTVAVAPKDLDAFMELCRLREVEATDLGEFTDTGRFEVVHGDHQVVDLSLEFLHEGWPQRPLQAEWAPPKRTWTLLEDRPLAGDDLLLALMARPNMATHEDRARAYDHEVKGLSVIKPLVGRHRDVPATASVMRVRHGQPGGVVLSEGVHPFYSDLDTYDMAVACVDEAVRRVVCAGAVWDRLSALDNFCWPDPVRSETTPDGAHKLAQLVRCCQGLYDACVAYGVPLISGKDSMKNDAYLDGVKISIPPTLLVSVMGQMPDVRAALSLEPQVEGDDVWVLGPPAEHLGGSEIARQLEVDVDGAPALDIAAAAERYQAFVAERDAGRVRSAHVVGRGGLAAALAHMTLASDRGIEVELDGRDASDWAALFGETPGRILFTARPADADTLSALEGHGARRIGKVGPRGDAEHLRVRRESRSLLNTPLSGLRAAYSEGLRGL